MKKSLNFQMWNIKKKKTSRYEDEPPDPNKAVATPDTYRTTFGSIRMNWKSPKSTFRLYVMVKY